MPIRPEMRERYPANWTAISRRIRFDRAQAQCECEGECGESHGGKLDGVPFEARCRAIHTQPIEGKRIGRLPNMRGRVVLTVAHLDHTPEHCSDDNLKAMCQRCHLRYDAAEHARTRKRRRK